MMINKLANYNVHILDNVDSKLCIPELPIKFTGAWSKCAKWAKEKLLTWKNDCNIFGGYWVDVDGNCYYLTEV